jgi:Ca-activated chloride channel family protein
MKARKPGVVSRIVVLTDGQTWGDADRCKQLAAQAGGSGIPITALGVGAEEDWSIELLDAMAMESGGDSGYIARPEEISLSIEGTVLAMQQTVARNLRLTVDPAAGVSVRALYRVAPVISRLWPGQEASGVETFEGLNVETLNSDSEPIDDSSTGVDDDKSSNVQTFKRSNVAVPLGDLQGSQTLLLEMILPARKPGQYRLARLSLQYEVAGRDQAVSETAVDVVAKFAAGVQRGPGDPRVMNNVERATTFKLQTRALQASMLGDVATATRSLRAAATRLLNMGETELAEAAESEAQLLETKGRMSSAGTKKLAFDTRRLALSETEGINPATVRLDEELPVEG